MKHNQRCNEQNITSFKTSNETHLYWRKYFHKNLLYFRSYADFEADNEIDNSSIGNKTTNLFSRNPVCKGFFIVSEKKDV